MSITHSKNRTMMLQFIQNPTKFVHSPKSSPSFWVQQNLRNVEQFEWLLFSGTLRRSLDPFAQHDEATLNDALCASGLFSLQADGDEARLTLDSDIASGGNNLSVGQRQII